MNNNTNNWKRKKLKFLLFILIMISVLPAVVMLIWNAVLPEVIGVNQINYWQALGILILSKILFGGFKPGRRRNHKPNKFKEKFMGMDDKQKLAFKEEWRKRCDKE